jgi:hypothetical protein
MLCGDINVELFAGGRRHAELRLSAAVPWRRLPGGLLDQFGILRARNRQPQQYMRELPT